MIRHTKDRCKAVSRRFTSRLPGSEHICDAHVHRSDLTGETSASADWNPVRTTRCESSGSDIPIGRRHADYRYHTPTIQAHITRCNRACPSTCVLMAGSMRHPTDIVGVAHRPNCAPHAGSWCGSRGDGAMPNDIRAEETAYQSPDALRLRLPAPREVWAFFVFSTAETSLTICRI